MEAATEKIPIYEDPVLIPLDYTNMIHGESCADLTVEGEGGECTPEEENLI